MPELNTDYLAGRNLGDRLRKSEERIEHLERTGATGLSGTDKTIRNSHDRVDSIIGAEKSVPDGTLTPLLNADFVDSAHMPYPDAMSPWPTIWDDEFNGDTLNPKWTALVDPGVYGGMNDPWPSHYNAYFITPQKFINLTEPFVPLPNTLFTIYARYRLAIHISGAFVTCTVLNTAATEGMSCVLERWATTNKMRMSMMSLDASVWTHRFYFEFDYPHASPVLSLRREGDNIWRMAASWDGFCFVVCPTTYGKVFTAEKLRLTICSGDLINPGQSMGVDWVRVNWHDYLY